MKYLLLLTGLFLFSFTVQAQQKISIKGKVVSTDGNPLPEATVVLLNKNGKDSLKTVSTDKGLFAFNEIQQGVYLLRISFVGYTPVTNEYDCTKTENELVTGDIALNPSNQTLQNLTLESQKVQIKEDTVSYKIDSTMYRKNDNVETLLKQLPGVQVDKDGTVTAQGKQVTKVKVNGKEFFGGDVTTATRELNADMVDRVQIIDDYGDQAAFTGVKDGDPTKTLNIQLKKDRNKGYFGTVTAGAGTEDRYLGSLSVNKFNNDQQISLLANINNTNASLFNFGSGGGAMGNMMAGMARSMGIGRGGGGIGSALGNFGNSDGINTNKSIGLNYRDQWGPKLSVYGSYSFSKKYSDVTRDITQQNIFRRKNQYQCSANE
ncbi:MAG: carboxypeptidase-like regulatory domain-containing protein [Ferruginibacter sp.]